MAGFRRRIFWRSKKERRDCTLPAISTTPFRCFEQHDGFGFSGEEAKGIEERPLRIAQDHQFREWSLLQFGHESPSMHTIRIATEADSATIARQRVKMFQENDLSPVTTWEDLERASLPWTAGKIRDGSYVGWIVEAAADGEPGNSASVIGGAGIWFMEWPPHFLDLEPVRGYLLNVYVERHARGQGIAKELVGLAVAECARRGVRVATLHASKMGRPIYEALGWINSDEMMTRPASLTT
jgi:ribosomal protein S18 acetylase RimI-like enzyme